MLRKGQVAVLALALVGMMATAARADIFHIDDFTTDGPIGNPTNEVNYVITNYAGPATLEFFGKSPGAADDPDAADEFSKVTFDTSPDGCPVAGCWFVSWEGIEGWSLEYLLVKDGATAGVGHHYSLFGVTDDQATEGGGFVYLGSELAGAISHVTLMGVPTNGTSVPEPGVLILLGTGLVGTVIARRRFGK